MPDKNTATDAVNELYDVILSLKSREDCRLLFEDLCTFKEVEQMAQRVQAAKLLLEGHTYNEITDVYDISTATVSRVSRCVQYGNGYKKFIKTDKKP